MVAKKTTEAYSSLMAHLRSVRPSVAPKALEQQLLGEGFSRADIQRAIQLALSNGSVKLDKSMKFEVADLQAA